MLKSKAHHFTTQMAQICEPETFDPLGELDTPLDLWSEG